MKEYMLIFRNDSGDGKYIKRPEDMQIEMTNWQNWIGKIAQDGNLVSTQPIDYEGILVTNNGTHNNPHIINNQMVVGYLICKSENFDSAVKLSEKCPILDYENGSVEVRQMTPFNM